MHRPIADLLQVNFRSSLKEGRRQCVSTSIRQTTLVSHGRVQDRVEFFFLVMFFLKKEDRPGHALPLATRDRARWSQARRLGGLNPLGNSRGFCSWRVLGPILTLSWLILAFKTLQDASKTASRPSKMPPRASKTSKTPPAGGPKTSFFLVFSFNVFAFQSYLDPTRPPRRLQ